MIKNNKNTISNFNYGSVIYKIWKRKSKDLKNWKTNRYGGKKKK